MALQSKILKLPAPSDSDESLDTTLCDLRFRALLPDDDWGDCRWLPGDDSRSVSLMARLPFMSARLSRSNSADRLVGGAACRD